MAVHLHRHQSKSGKARSMQVCIRVYLQRLAVYALPFSQYLLAAYRAWLISAGNTRAQTLRTPPHCTQVQASCRRLRRTLDLIPKASIA